MDYMSKQESYLDRRQLFKSIWDTAMSINDADASSEILKKSKAIKALRLDEVDRCIVERRKKQRIKNLRTVCNKILKFCDKQDADDCSYEQYYAITCNKQDQDAPQAEQPKKLKLVRKRRKVRRAKSLFNPGTDSLQTKSNIKTRRSTTPAKTTRKTILRNSSVFKTQPRMKAPNVEANLFGDNANHRRSGKVVKKKSLKTTQAAARLN